ncbi:hypothetical protein Tco_0802891 [Tanacetum coccineum]|uniref:RNA-directed DNA polymerase, eukaryota, reverse transcriptase zinc-binding domain protein n=1 Tax=Tanacetum coccineum TaxID=301880 RepID=A0ABQ5A079_9ASTR
MRKLFGIGVSDVETNNFASYLNLQPSSLPCIYLGLPISVNMNKGIHWKPIIDKFNNCLTSWKARTLSYGGRLALVKLVLGALDAYSNKIAWIGWKKVCSPTKIGCLGIGSILASNLSMLTKWWWRFNSDINSNALWKVVNFRSWV